jgi:hypothetical protein
MEELFRMSVLPCLEPRRAVSAEARWHVFNQAQNEVMDQDFPDSGQVSSNERCSGAPIHCTGSKQVRKLYHDHGGSWCVNSHISMVPKR